MILSSSMEGTSTFVQVLAALAPVFVLLLGGLGWLYRHERERRQGIERQLSEYKYKAYIALIDLFFEMFKRTATGQDQVDQISLIESMTNANKELILYGSDDVLRVYQQFLGQARKGTVDMSQFGQLVIAIRKDMGNSSTEITSDDVLRQLITDFDAAKARGELIQEVGD